MNQPQKNNSQTNSFDKEDFIKQNIKTKHQEKDINYGFELGIFVAIIGYLVAGIFNDSAVSVAPIFWLLLGTGINLLKRNEKI